MKRKLTNTGRILDVLNKSFGLTRAELANRLGESRDTIRKTLHAMLKDERIARVIGDDGVEIYNITDAGKARLTREVEGMTSVIKPYKPVYAPIPDEVLQQDCDHAINKAWSHMVEEAEQRGFAKGYAEGIKTSQAQAYQDAKLDIVKKLVGVVT